MMSLTERRYAARARPFFQHLVSGIGGSAGPVRTDEREATIRGVRADGETQHCTASDGAAIADYVALKREGTAFPPIAVWTGRQQYWLTDRFQRLAAADRSSRTRIVSEVRLGNLSDARWDSYGSNAAHGLRRRREETGSIIFQAVRYPRAATLSNIGFARQLAIPETTVVRWWQRLSPAGGDGVPVVNWGRGNYEIQRRSIGKTRRGARSERPAELRPELLEMKGAAFVQARRLLNIVANWATGSASPEGCLIAIKADVREPRSAPDRNCLPEEEESTCGSHYRK